MAKRTTKPPIKSKTTSKRKTNIVRTKNQTASSVKTKTIKKSVTVTKTNTFAKLDSPRPPAIRKINGSMKAKAKSNSPRPKPKAKTPIVLGPNSALSPDLKHQLKTSNPRGITLISHPRNKDGTRDKRFKSPRILAKSGKVDKRYKSKKT